jgi:membrane carboxypeptidase/penicillin-binding protein PbpC
MAVDRQQIPLEAEAAGDALLSWFVDGAFLGTVAATERIWWTPEAGSHEVVVTDERGRLAKRALVVRSARGEPSVRP